MFKKDKMYLLINIIIMTLLVIILTGVIICSEEHDKNRKEQLTQQKLELEYSN